jgi:protein SCO1
MSQNPRAKEPTWLLVLVGTLMGAIFVVAGVILLRDVQPDDSTAGDQSAAVFEQVDAQDNAFVGAEVIDPPRPMPDFTLTNQQNDAVSLSDLRGKPTLITFGFTNCPDVCPLTLYEWRQISAELDTSTTAATDAINFVFISVDGERDTPEALQRYFAVRGVEEFVGLTGPEDQLRRVVVDYGATFVYNEPDENGRYSVDHTPSYFLLDEQGRWIKTYAFGTLKQVIVDDLREITEGL